MVHTAARVRAAAVRSRCLSLANTSSIGFRFKYTVATSTFGVVYSFRGAFGENAYDGCEATGLLLDKGMLYGTAYHTTSFSGA